jgi:hypothetical protein
MVALVGLLATVFAGMLQSYFQTRAARELERQRFEAALIQKAVETANADEGARRLQFLVSSYSSTNNFSSSSFVGDLI